MGIPNINLAVLIAESVTFAWATIGIWIHLKGQLAEVKAESDNLRARVTTLESQRNTRP